MKFTRIVLLCNLCWQETGGDVENAAAQTLIFKTSDESDDWFRLDVCDVHASNGTPLEDLLHAAEALDSLPVVKRAVSRPRKAEASVDLTVPAHNCPVCDNPYASKGGVSLHMKAKHPDDWGLLVMKRARHPAHEQEAIDKEARN